MLHRRSQAVFGMPNTLVGFSACDQPCHLVGSLPLAGGVGVHDLKPSVLQTCAARNLGSRTPALHLLAAFLLGARVISLESVNASQLDEAHAIDASKKRDTSPPSTSTSSSPKASPLARRASTRGTPAAALDKCSISA